jgi:beta-glucanase (GH16 family)
MAVTTLQEIIDGVQAYAADQVAAAKAPLQQAIDAQTATINDLRAKVAALTPAPAPVPAFSDDFASLDRAKWNVRQEAEGGSRQGYCRPENVTAQSDGLHITCRRESYGGRQYTTGYIDTIGKHAASTGRWDVVAKLPTAEGAWPAIWLRNADLGEIDIMEAVGGYPGSIVQTVHESTNGDMRRAGFEAKPVGFDPAAFHTYSLSRDADGTLRWFIDGKRTVTRTPAAVPWIAGPQFASPFHLRINTQVGGSMPSYYGHNINAGSVLPDDFVIKSVRYWKDAS